MTITLLITKTFHVKKNIILFLPLIDHMCKISNLITDSATKQSGFINSQSFWDLNNYDRILTMAKWKSDLEWNEWLDSTERSDIFKNIDFLDVKTSVSSLLPKMNFNSVSLL